MYRRNKSKARDWTNTTWSWVCKVEPKGILWQISMIPMFQGHPWHPGCNRSCTVSGRQLLPRTCCFLIPAPEVNQPGLEASQHQQTRKAEGGKKAAEVVFYRYQKNHNSFCCYLAASLSVGLHLQRSVAVGNASCGKECWCTHEQFHGKHLSRASPLVISRKDKQQPTYFYIQLQNVSSSVQKGPNVGLCSPKVSVYKLFNVAGKHWLRRGGFHTKEIKRGGKKSAFSSPT